MENLVDHRTLTAAQQNDGELKEKMDDKPFSNVGELFHSLHSRCSALEEMSSIYHTQVINAVILFLLISHDKHVEQLALMHDIRTRDQFHQEIKVFSHARKRLVPSPNDPSTEPGVKRSRPSGSRTKCYHCGITEHRMAECRKRIWIETQKTRRPEGSRPATSSKVVASSVERRAISHLIVRYGRREKAVTTRNVESTTAW